MSFIVEPPFSGGTLTGPLTLPAGSVAAPSLLFTASGSSSGFYAEVNKIALSVNGTQIAYANTNSLWAAGSQGLGILNDIAPFYIGGSADLIIRRDSAGVLAQRNGTNAQTFKVYGTTDAGLTNYERLAISAQQGVGFTIGAETLGTGADNLDIGIVPAGTGLMRYGTHNAIGAETVTGFINIKDSGGTTRKLAVVS